MPAQVVDSFNVEGKEYHIEPVLDPVPIENSQHAVMSGGVFADKSSVPVEGSTKNFTAGGAYDMFLGATTPAEFENKLLKNDVGVTFKPLSNDVSGGLGCFYTYGISGTAPTPGGYGNPKAFDFYDGMAVFGEIGGTYGLWWCDDNVHWHMAEIDGVEQGYSSSAFRRFTFIKHVTLTNDSFWLAGIGDSAVSDLGHLSKPLLKSSDGKHWSIVSSFSPYVATMGAFDIIVENDVIYILLSDSASQTQKCIYYSSDGCATWTRASYNIGSTAYSRIKHVGDYYYVFDTAWSEGGAEPRYNDDLQSGTWRVGGLSGKVFKDMLYADSLGLYIAASNNGSGALYWSENGTSWSTASGSTAEGYYQLLYSDGAVLAVNANGSIYRTTDGKNWTAVMTGAARGCRCIAKFGNKLVVAGGQPYYSTDNGVTWARASGMRQSEILSTMYVAGNKCYTYRYADGLWGSSDGISYYSLRPMFATQAMAYAEDRHVLVASARLDGTWYTTDGVAWYQSDYSLCLNVITYKNGLFVGGSSAAAGGSGGLYWSEDGIEWHQSNITSLSNAYCIVYANGMWVAGCGGTNNGGVYWSTDGKTWTLTTTSTLQGATIRTVVYAGYGRWILGTDTHGAWWSDDGKTWTQTTTTAMQSLTLYALCLASDCKYNFGGASIFAGSANSQGVWISSDLGKTWSKSSQAEMQSLSVYSISLFKGSIVVVASSGLYVERVGATSFANVASQSSFVACKSKAYSRYGQYTNDGTVWNVGMQLMLPDGSIVPMGGDTVKGVVDAFGKILIFHSYGAPYVSDVTTA